MKAGMKRFLTRFSIKQGDVTGIGVITATETPTPTTLEDKEPDPSEVATATETPATLTKARKEELVGETLRHFKESKEGLEGEHARIKGRLDHLSSIVRQAQSPVATRASKGSLARWQAESHPMQNLLAENEERLRDLIALITAIESPRPLLVLPKVQFEMSSYLKECILDGNNCLEEMQEFLNLEEKAWVTIGFLLEALRRNENSIQSLDEAIAELDERESQEGTLDPELKLERTTMEDLKSNSWRVRDDLNWNIERYMAHAVPLRGHVESAKSRFHIHRRGAEALLRIAESEKRAALVLSEFELWKQESQE